MIYEKPKNEIFASDAKDGEIVEFPNIKRGWGVTENLGFIPPMEYFNAAFNRVDKSLAYQLQRGVGEWDKDMEYPIGAVVSLGEIIYIAKSQNTNKSPANEAEVWDAVATKKWSDKKFALKDDLPSLATEAKEGIAKLKNSITAKQEDAAVTEKAIVEYINKDVAITGNATFSGTKNNIVMTGIGGITLAVGDVIEISGTTNNNKLFMVESIVGKDEIIVNYEHRGTSTPIPPKRLKNETSTCTIKLYNRAKNAPLGQGQGWCVPSSGRGKNTKYTNSTGREIAVAINFAAGGNGTVLETDGVASLYFYGNTTSYVPGFSIEGGGSIYELRSSSGSILSWYELR